VASKHSIGRNKRGRATDPSPLGGTLIVAEDEQLIFSNRAADGSAVLVALQGVADRLKEVAGVQFFVSGELECVPVPLVRARFGYDADHCSWRKPVLRFEVIPLDAELLRCVGVGKRSCEQVVVVEVAGAIEQVIRASLPSAISGRARLRRECS